MHFEDDKCYVSKAGDAYNLNNHPTKKCRVCDKGHKVWTSHLVLHSTIPWNGKFLRSPAVGGDEGGQVTLLGEKYPVYCRGKLVPPKHHIARGSPTQVQQGNEIGKQKLRRAGSGGKHGLRWRGGG